MIKNQILLLIVLLSLQLFAQNGMEQNKNDKSGWLKDFKLKPENLSSTGSNDYFILKPGYRLVLKGKEENTFITLTITVLNETKLVGGFETRIVEEREIKNEKLSEVSKNYFAIDKRTGDVYYFGEAVDNYKNGKLNGHNGSWEFGKDDARFGLLMPGKIRLGEKYYQEIAPKVAMDRAEIISNKTKIKTNAGAFTDCLKTEETSPLEPDVKEYKVYAPGIGLVKDDSLVLMKYGYLK